MESRKRKWEKPPQRPLTRNGAHGVTRPTRPRFVIRHSSFVIPLLIAASLQAAQQPTDDIPPLAPPLPEIPPALWEQFGWTLWILIPLALAFAALVVVLWRRPRTPPALIAPAAQARAVLAALQTHAGDGATLSHISQTLRRYLITVFWLHPGETTTAEFCAVLSANVQVGPELSGAVGEFLRACDERKFSPAASPAATGAASRALELVELAEVQRGKLHAPAQMPKPA